MENLNHFSRALTVFRSHDATIPSQRVAAFMAVANGCRTQKEVAQRVGISPNAAGRNLNALTSNRYTIHPYCYPQGLGFLDVKPDPSNVRRKLYSLSPKGRAILYGITVEEAA